MATTSIRNGSVLATHTVTSSWTDVVTSISGAANVAGLLKKVSGDGVVKVVKGGSTAPDAASIGSDVLMVAGDAVFCETDKIWVQCVSGSPRVAFETL